MSETAPDNSTSSSKWSADELIPFGKYILLERIASGATAAVYRGKHRGEAGFERLVSIKRILPHMAGDPEFVRTFVKEAKTAARLNHTNICPIYELGKVGESLYMAMECVMGKDLGRITRRLHKNGETMPPIIAAWIAAKLCEALDYAHTLKDARGQASGIIHRDLSPANIMVSYEGQVKLIDFGVAKAVGRAQQTNVDALKKKLGYMSPEMVKGRPLDARTDIFGVGVCLYEMITSRRLFVGKDDMATLSMVAKASVPPPSALVEDAPEDLEQIVMKALEREPDERWQDAAEMAHALMSYVASCDPHFGTRGVTEWMLERFGEEQVSEQEHINVLLKASNDEAIIEARKEFFLSPSGAAAIARAEVERRLSTQPPPVMQPEPKLIPDNPVPKLNVPTTQEGGTPFEEDEATAFYSGESKPPADDEEATAFFEAAGKQAPPTAASSQPSPFQGEDEATAFYGEDGQPAAPPAAPPAGADPFGGDSTEFLDGDALQSVTVSEEHVDGLGFDEDATEIFFNKEDGVGIDDLLAEVESNPSPPLGLAPPRVDMAQLSEPVSHPAPGQASIPAQALPPQGGYGQPRPARATHRTAEMEVPAEQGSNWMLMVGMALLTLAVAGLVAKTPVGVMLGVRKPRVGAIEVRTSPSIGAAVKLDDIFRGKAPLRLDGVRAGTHRLEVHADGYTPVAREVTLNRGGTALLDISLSALPGSVPAPTAPTGATGTDRSTAAAEQAPSAGKGSLVINTTPFTKIFVDGQDTGKTTPVLGMDLEPGQHLVGMQTQAGVTHNETVLIKAGQTVRLIRRFE